MAVLFPSMPERIYEGLVDEKSKKRFGKSRMVTVNGKPLDPRFDVRSYSPTGFEWGYGGAGPTQLVIALTSDIYGADIMYPLDDPCPPFAAIRQIVREQLTNQMPWILGESSIRLRVEQIITEKERQKNHLIPPL
jgi:Family of unknown function (DUF6166)